jgi:hypothetical protein
MFAIVSDRLQRYFYLCKANPFCREAEMIDLKKKCWREKVTAEITLAHVLQFAREAGTNMNTAEVAAFLNEKGRAQDVWTHMMQAGEEYIKSSLEHSTTSIHSLTRPAAHPGAVHQQRLA